MGQFVQLSIAEVFIAAQMRSRLQQLEVDVFAAHLAAREKLAAQQHGFVIAAMSPVKHAVETALGNRFTGAEQRRGWLQ